MQLNVTTDYAIRTVLYLAVKDELATANEIATAMGIPPSYVLKITRKLVAAVKLCSGLQPIDDFVKTDLRLLFGR